MKHLLFPYFIPSLSLTLSPFLINHLIHKLSRYNHQINPLQFHMYFFFSFSYTVELCELCYTVFLKFSGAVLIFILLLKSFILSSIKLSLPHFKSPLSFHKVPLHFFLSFSKGLLSLSLNYISSTPTVI